jgi:hypothetical protein
MSELERVREKVDYNIRNGLPRYEGLLSHEIGTLNRAEMFGDDDEAFPDEWEWSLIVD